MRKTGLYFAAAVVALSALAGCKTNENNYRQAYEAAVAHNREGSAVDSTVYARIRNSARTSTLKVDTASYPMRTEYLGYTDEGGSSREHLKRYSVVAGQFKQVFNARAMRKRLMEGGYPGAFIVHTREPLYYVCTATFSSPDSAGAEMKRVLADKALVLRSPLPFVLQPATLAR